MKSVRTANLDRVTSMSLRKVEKSGVGDGRLGLKSERAESWVSEDVRPMVTGTCLRVKELKAPGVT